MASTVTSLLPGSELDGSFGDSSGYVAMKCSLASTLDGIKTVLLLVAYALKVCVKGESASNMRWVRCMPVPDEVTSSFQQLYTPWKNTAGPGSSGALQEMARDAALVSAWVAARTHQSVEEWSLLLGCDCATASLGACFEVELTVEGMRLLEVSIWSAG
eukprot:4945572-Amphidinium_carterae.2